MSSSIAALIADGNPTPTGMAGPVALFLILLLCVACAFLFRSMSRHLKRVPLAFDGDPRDDPAAGGAAPVGANDPEVEKPAGSGA